MLAMFVAATVAQFGIVTSPQVPGVAYVQPDGRLAVQLEDGRTARYARPDGCTPAALTRAEVGLTCGDEVRVLTRRSGVIRTVALDVPNRSSYALKGLGRRWLHVVAGGARDVPGGHVDRKELLVNRGDGRVVDLERDPFGARRTLDLNRPSGARKLCRGVRRTSATAPGTRYAPMTMINRRVFSPAAPSLTDCRTGRVRKLPARASLAYTGTVPHILNATLLALPGDGRTTLVRLRTGKRRVIAHRSTYGVTVALSRGALWIREDDGTLRHVSAD